MITVGDAYQLFHDGAIALAKVEANGMRIDVSRLDREIARNERKIQGLLAELKADPVFATWRRTWGSATNIGSRPQLGRVLFDVMKVPCKAWSAKSKRPKVDEAALSQIDLPFVKKWQEAETVRILNTTFFGGIKQEISGEYIHPVFDLHTVTSYRGSSSSPNAQNFKKDKRLRRCFIPEDGDHFVELDFGGHEFRIAAAVHADPEMIRYASDPNMDVHRDYAAKIFSCKKDQIAGSGKALRQLTKANFIFATLYGSYWFKTAKGLWEGSADLTLADGTPVWEHLKSKNIRELGADDTKSDPAPGSFRRHVKSIEDGFMRTFSTFARAKEETYVGYQKNGGIRLVTGFWVERMKENGKAGVGGLCTKNFILNVQVQGPAFHCLLWCLIQIQRELEKRGMKARIIGTVHDSILASVPAGEIQVFLKLAKRIMTVDIRKVWDWLVVPLEAEAGVSDVNGNWWDRLTWIDREGVWGPKEERIAT